MYGSIGSMKKDKRGEWWKNIPMYERTLRGAYASKKRWDKTTREERVAYSRMMNRIKNKKNGK